MAPATTTTLILAPLLLSSSLILSSVSAAADTASLVATTTITRDPSSATRADSASGAIRSQQQQSRSLLRRGSRALFCLFDWDCEDGEEGLIGDFEFPCLFFCPEEDKVDEDKVVNGTKAPTPAPVPVNYTLCNNRTDGIFGGRPLFGECGVLTEFVDNLFNETDSNGDGQFDSVTVGNPFEADSYVADDELFLRLFPEGSLLWEIFNEEDDEEFVESVLGSYREITDLFSNGFVDDWVQSVAFSNNTCRAVVANTTNATAVSPEPTCLNLHGGEGFWVCRTLYDPFDGTASNQSVCIDKGEYLAKNDKCGCCGQACPKPCPCKCNLGGGVNNGVIVQYYLFDSDIVFGNRCVSPEFSVAATARYGENIDCLLECPVPKNNTSGRV